MSSSWRRWRRPAMRPWVPSFARRASIPRRSPPTGRQRRARLQQIIPSYTRLSCCSPLVGHSALVASPPRSYSAATLSLVKPGRRVDCLVGIESDGGIAALELHLDEARLAGRKRVLQEIDCVGQLRRARGGDAERAGKPDEIDGGIGEVHPDIAIGLRGKALHGVGALLQDAVGAIVENDEDDGDAVMGGGPQRLAGVHGAAVADERHDWTIRQGELDADGGRQAPADAAAAQPKEALRVVAADEL